MKTVSDPRLHLSFLALMAVCIFLMQTQAQLHLLFICSILYVASHGRLLRAVQFCIAYGTGTVLLMILPGSVGVVLIMLFIALRIMPMLAIGSLLSSSPPSVIMLAGSKLRMPKMMLIMICILMRFVSVIRQEMRDIGQGIRARGLLPHWYSAFIHPVRSYECLILPLIIRGLRLSGEITCAAEFRGMESTTSRSSIYTMTARPVCLRRFSAYAVLCAVVMLAPRWLP